VAIERASGSVSDIWSAYLSVQTVQALYLLTQRRNLLVEPGDLGLRYRFPLAIGAVEL
jgi:hypothetical protein